MNGRNVPLSPVSLGGSEWSAISRYQSIEDGRHDPNNPANRNQLISPPNSGGSDGRMNMNGAFPPRNASGPSPPQSVTGSFNGSTIYARSESGRMSTGTRDPERVEAVLGEHYLVLRNFLQEGDRDRDPRAGQAPNKGKDKLLRLSATQFLELSTDVFDELVRRQLLQQQRGSDASPNEDPLKPEVGFHPKRNQARQKLSSLGPPRFRELALDVFLELERRIPRFAAGDIPRAPSVSSRQERSGSRSRTPVNGNMRIRKPSDASSLRGTAPYESYGMPPSPGLPPGDFGRPMQKQFQSNTIVPNKSTMVEEDDDDAAGREFSRARDTSLSKGSRMTGRSALGSEVGKKLIDDYQTQVMELRDKLDGMEDQLKRKDDEVKGILERERSRATETNLERQDWRDQKMRLESRLAEAQDMSSSLREDLARERDEHMAEMRALRQQQLESQPPQRRASPSGDAELRRENEELREYLRQQQQVTEEVRRDAQRFLQEMRQLSQQSGSSWERQTELEKTIEQVEKEAHEWRTRYARAKTQLRSMRASSMGLSAEQDAGRYVRERGFTADGGLVKDVHVTKFQISVNELLQKARHEEDPDKVVEAMKLVVGNVRRITRDIDEGPPRDEQPQQTNLKSKVSATANNLITASKNFAASAGISPVSLLDAAAGHLVAAIVDLLRAVKIRPTPAGELDDDDDAGMATPTESTQFFSQRTMQGNPMAQQNSQQRPMVYQRRQQDDSDLPPPPPFQGLAGIRDSAVSSAYSPVNSPRESTQQYRQSNGVNGAGMSRTGPQYPNMNGVLNGTLKENTNGAYRDRRAEDLKIYLEDQTAILVSDIQNLVGSIRGDVGLEQLQAEIESIASVVMRVIGETEACGYADMVARLSDCRLRLLEAGQHGTGLAAQASGPSDRDWRMWTGTLPPIVFEIARETKALVQRVDQMVGGDEFA